MTQTEKMFGTPKAMIGMIHVGALPGTPGGGERVGEIASRAGEEARALTEGGFDGILIENMHDAPYLMRDEVGPEIVAGMTAAALAVRGATDLPVGIQILAGQNKGAMAAAQAAGLDFVRAEGFVFASVTDEGLMARADAGPLLRYRKQIGAEHIRVFADIKKKHAANAITSDVSLADTARNAELFGADGLIITGVATGQPTDPGHIAEARKGTDLPLLVGSGVTPDSVAPLFGEADALIVGTWFKEEADWRRGPDPARVRVLIDAANAARGA